MWLSGTNASTTVTPPPCWPTCSRVSPTTSRSPSSIRRSSWNRRAPHHTSTPMTELTPAPLLGGRFRLRRAVASDVQAIVELLVEDTRRAAIETSALEARSAYEQAFQRVDADASQLLVVTTDASDVVVATMQLTFIPGLSRAGSTRLQLEAVRVRADQRSNGLGGALMEWAIQEGKRRGARLMQLTSDASRLDAHRFYDRLGFVASHVGYKLDLD